VGCKYLAHEVINWTPARFHLELGIILSEAVTSEKSSTSI
jgi:hypothetical protein